MSFCTSEWYPNFAGIKTIPLKLKNKVAVITGGNSGIGFGIAEAFKSEGAKGTITGRNAETLKESIAQLGGDFIAIADPARR